MRISRNLLMCIALTMLALMLASCSQGTLLDQLAVVENENAIVRVCGEVSTSQIPFVGGTAEINYVEIPANIDVTGVTPEDLENILDCD